jgi:hypothetical protein
VLEIKNCQKIIDCAVMYFLKECEYEACLVR